MRKRITSVTQYFLTKPFCLCTKESLYFPLTNVQYSFIFGRSTSKKHQKCYREKTMNIDKSKEESDCFHFESDILQYFQWRISTIPPIIVEGSTGDSGSNNDDNAPTPKTAIIGITARNAKALPKRTKKDPVGEDVITTNKDDDQPNIAATGTTAGGQSATVSTSSLLEKYKKVFDFLHFINPSEQPLPSDTTTNDSILVEPDVFISWKKNRLLKPALVQQVPVPQAATPTAIATPATTTIKDDVHENPTTTTTMELDNNVEENTPAVFNDIGDNFDFSGNTDTPVSTRETRKRKIPGRPLTARKSVGVSVTTTRKRRKVQKTETSDILTPDAEDVFTLPTSQEPEDKKIKQVKLLANVPVQVKKTVQKAQKAAAAAKLKAEKLEAKLLKSSITVGAGEEKLKEKLSKLKEKLKKKRDEALAKEKKLKEGKKKKQEAKKLRMEGNKKSYDKWEDRYKQLSEFYEKYGHCKVTRQMRDENNNLSKHIRALGEWVSDQRKYYRRKSKLLTQERIDMMNNIRFIWNPETYQKTFQMRVTECKKFKEKYGHLTVPLFDALVDGKYPTEEEKRFRLWAQSIRHQYKRRVVLNANNKLDKLKIQALNDVGFDWGDTSTGTIELGTVVNKDRFLDRINQLKMCHDQYGTCNDRKLLNLMFPNDDSLYLWMKTQRKKYNKFLRGESVPSLSAERQKMLREVKFDFNPRDNTPNGKGATGSRMPNDNTPDNFSPIPIPVAYNETRDREYNDENYYR